jgi:hypothetical protein
LVGDKNQKRETTSRFTPVAFGTTSDARSWHNSDA